MATPLLLAAAALAGLLAPAVSAAALDPRQQVTATPAPVPWISIDENGAGRTVTPTVVTTNNVQSTVSPAPSYLAGDKSSWLMSIDGKPTTSYAYPPAPSATGSGKQGAVLVCQNYIGNDAPFCQPERGSLLNPGSTYYITWNPLKFGNQDDNITIQMLYDNGHSVETDKPVQVSAGFYPWTIPDQLLESYGNRTALGATIMYNIEAPDESDHNEIRFEGPKVTITREQMLIPSPSSGGPAGVGFLPVVIAVPILAVIILALAGWCFWGWRKKGVVPGAAAVGALKRRSAGGGQGYGVRRNRTERAAGAGATEGGFSADDKDQGGRGIQLSDRSPTSPTGTNVFREEIERQQNRR